MAAQATRPAATTFSGIKLVEMHANTEQTAAITSDADAFKTVLA